MDTITFTAASYNIHRCVGTDGRYDVGRVTRVIAGLDADIVGLQEVSTGCDGEPSEQLRQLQAETGYQVVPGPTFLCHRRGQFGNALLTRLSIRSFRSIDLSASRREPRGAIDAELDVHGHRLRVVCTHLGLNRFERHYQVSMLLKALARMEPGPVILMGDLNEWYPRRRTLGRLTDRFGKTPWARSFPAIVPMLGLDRIYAGGWAEIRSFKAVYNRATRVASDHLPVRAEVAILVARNP